jgi:hypothetical protein
MRLIIFVSVLIILLNVVIIQEFSVNIFTENFIKDFFINLLPNSIAILFGILVVNLLIEKNKLKNLKKINKSKSEHIKFQLNVFNLDIIEYLGIISESEKREQMNKDKKVNFDWATKKIIDKLTNIDSIYLANMIKSLNRENFINGFINIINKRMKSLRTTLKEIYPHQSPTVIKITEDISYNEGGLKAIGYLVKILKETSEKTAKDSKPTFSTKQIDLFLSDAYFHSFANPSTICNKIIEIYRLSENNNLFAEL